MSQEMSEKVEPIINRRPRLPGGFGDVVRLGSYNGSYM